MRGKTLLGLVVIGLAAFVGGWFFAQPSRAQPKDEKPAPAVPGRFQPVTLTGGDFAVVDTGTGHTWKYAASLGVWGDLGVPAEELKKK
jgi:hypothetical protein